MPINLEVDRLSKPLLQLMSVAALSVVMSGIAYAQPGGPASPVVVAKVLSTSQAASKSFVGTLVPIRKSVVGSAVDGRVVEILVDDGDAVSMVDGQQDADGHPLGQPMVQLRTVSLDIEISAAEVELKIRKDSEEELKQTLPTEIESAQAAVEEIKARLQYSKDDYDRLKDLAQQGGGIPKREIDEAFSTYSSQVQLNVAAQSLLKKLTSTKEVRLSQARSRIEAQEAELRRLNELKDKYTIRAPFSGYVTSKMTELGQWVSRGDQVLEIVQLDPIELVINVPQSYIGQLQSSLDRSRQENKKYLAQISVESVPKLLEGEVLRIVPQADLRSRSFPVIIRLENPESSLGHLLKSGMLARASLFITGRDEQILLVKKDALVLGGPQINLYVISKDPQTQTTVARVVAVQIGASIGDWIQVTGTIQEGDLVVIEGNERLSPGQTVQIAREVSQELPSEMKQIKGHHSNSSSK